MNLNITFKYSALAEYQRLLFTLNNIHNGFFIKNSFFLCNFPQNHPKSVIIPASTLNLSTEFWKQLKKDKNLNITYSISSPGRYRDLFNEVCKNKPIYVENYLQRWQAVQTDFIKFIECIYSIDVLNVNVFVTYFGTVSSFVPSKEGLTVYLRQDSDLSQVAFAILNYFFIQKIGNVEDFDHKQFTWETSQKLHEYLMLYTKLNLIFPEYKGVLLGTNKISKKQIENSNKILKSLGFLNKPKSVVSSNKILINTKEIKKLTKTEFRILEYLIKNKNLLVTYDNLASNIWGEMSENFFSLEAINKYIERIRSKIIISGINKEVIFCVRKMGYIYQD